MEQNQTDESWFFMQTCTAKASDNKQITCCGTSFSKFAAISTTNGLFSGGNPIALIILLNICLVIFSLLGNVMDRRKMFVFKDDIIDKPRGNVDSIS